MTIEYYQEAMMGKVRSALEVALEKAGRIGMLSKEERDRMQEEEKMTSLLREFYQGKLDTDGLWQKLKGNKPSLLVKAQMNLIETLSLGMSQEEFRPRKQAILAIETLKENQNTAVIESGLNALESLQREYEGTKEKVTRDLKSQMEKHPQMRMQPVRTPDGKTVMQMSVSVDEAVRARLAEYLSEHEARYRQEFSAVVDGLKEQSGSFPHFIGPAGGKHQG
jgi:hypothetical protein